MNVEIGTEAAQFPEKEYINGISLQCSLLGHRQKPTANVANILVRVYKPHCNKNPM
jgi:hypothetical protein